MKKRMMVPFLLILCLLMLSLAACSGPSVELPLGHRYGNPEIIYRDNGLVIKYICVDCDQEFLEERAASTLVVDAQAWDAAFKNLELTQYSVLLRTTNGENTRVQRCIVEGNRGYYGEHTPDGLAFIEECYTLQKKDGSYITYIRSGEEETTSIAPETDERHLENMKRESMVYVSLEGKFDQFIYNAENGSYMSGEPVEARLYDADGAFLGEKVLRDVAINIVDGKICRMEGNYLQVNEYLEEERIDFCFYNIGFSVVKVPQSMIDEVTGVTEPADPDPYGHTHSYDDGVVIQEPTCSAAGIKKCTCSICGKNKTEYIPKLTTHNYTNGICIDCGLEDPQYVAGNQGEDIDGILGAVVNLLQSLLQIIFFFV